MTDLKELFDAMIRDASVEKVFGEPVVAGDKTIIPVACIGYGFGGGGGSGRGKTPEQTGEGHGGGGGLGGAPAGVFEISASGTRFVAVAPSWKIGLALAVGCVAGYIWGRRK